jgi:hypothetical protein
MRWWSAVACGFLVAAAAGTVIALAHSGHDSPGAGPLPTLAVIPFPGTPDASPQSQVIFSSLVPRQIRGLTVTGSVSGRHGGRLSVLPAGAGTAFVPARPFTPGERVSVSLRRRRASSSRATRLSFWFRVAVAGAPEVTAAGGTSPGKTPPVRSFHSQPGLHPPPVTVGADPDGRSGDIFLTPNDTSQDGAMILNGRGQLVWFNPINRSTFNLAVQRYHGQPVLTWWQGKVAQGGWAESGQDVIMDRSYRILKVVRAAEGYAADVHEFQITDRGTALIDAFVPVRADLSSVGGPENGTVYDCVIQRLDIRTGRLLWEWHALGHVPLSASFRRPQGSKPFDYFHLNSIQQLPNGNLLISARNTWGVYEISGTTGKVLWTLGGKHSSFKMAPGAIFEWQHDVRRHGDLLTVFNDAWDGLAGDHEEDQSSAKVLRLGQHQVTLVHRYTHHPSVLASSEGSVQRLANGNLFVGWGADPDFSEFTPGGRQIFNGSLPKGVTSYRAYRQPWKGQPRTPPAMSMARAGRGLTVWASWNGATDVAAWRVVGGPSATHLTRLASKPARSFETTIRLPNRPRYLEVQAVGASGRVLGSSAVRGAP